MRNIQIAYVLSFLYRSWFWLGIWILYYLRFTDYAGIGFLEAVMITTMTLGEIPTGAIADIVGKKFALVLAFSIAGAGNVIMALAPSYPVLLFSIIAMTIGGTFYSGSLEALVYDTLKDLRKESLYQSVLGKMSTLQNLGMAIAGVTGGYLYTIHHSLPFLAVGASYVIAAAACFALHEPSVDTEKFSIKTFIRQTTQGFHQLFRNRIIASQSLLLIIPGSIMVATENVINDATAVEYGFSSTQLGILATCLYLFGAYVSSRTDFILKRYARNTLYIMMAGLYIVSLLATPYLTLYAGALLLIFRLGIQTLYGNLTSVVVNENTESRYRATTLSTYNLIHNIPYVLSATGIGLLMNAFTARTFSFYLGIGVAIAVALLLSAGLRFHHSKVR